MCYRTTAVFTDSDILNEKDFEVDTVLTKFSPRYNLAPTQQIPVIIPGSRILTTMRWGLIPPWAKDDKIGAVNANARAESIDEKPSFKNSFKNKRCLILSSGFFEWDAAKNPYLFTITDKKIFAFAGLWAEWHDPASNDKPNKESQLIRSCSIITCQPNSIVKQIHQRMPVILQPHYYSTWLTETNPEKLKPLLAPIDSNLMHYHEVTRKVNSIHFESPDTLKPIQPSEKQKTLLS